MNPNTFDSKIRPFNISKNVISEKVRKLMNFLEQPVSERSNYQTHQIALYLEEFQFFSRFASTGILLELIKHLKIEFFPIASIIIPWTASQSNFYLILTGRVGLYRKDDLSFDQGREFLSGSCFGENGIVNEMYKEEYRSLEPCQLMVLEKNIFEIVLSNTQKERYEEYYEFFRLIPLLEHISDNAVSHLAKVALPKKFAPGTLIAKQGDRPRGFYIIQSGSAKLLRNMAINHIGDKIPRIIEIDEVEAGESLCDYAFINQEPLEYSILCSMPIVTYFIDKDYFRGANQMYLNEIKAIATKIPDDRALSEKFMQKISWKRFKDNFLNTLDIKKKKNNEQKQVLRKVKLPMLKKFRNLSV